MIVIMCNVFLGAALFHTSNSTFYAANVSFTFNNASDGGAISSSASSTLILDTCSFENNSTF